MGQLTAIPSSSRGSSRGDQDVKYQRGDGDGDGEGLVAACVVDCDPDFKPLDNHVMEGPSQTVRWCKVNLLKVIYHLFVNAQLNTFIDMILRCQAEAKTCGQSRLCLAVATFFLVSLLIVGISATLYDKVSE